LAQAAEKIDAKWQPVPRLSIKLFDQIAGLQCFDESAPRCLSPACSQFRVVLLQRAYMAWNLYQCVFTAESFIEK
jgi:hypothetical protein